MKRRLTVACVLLACAAWLVAAGARQADLPAFTIAHGPYLQLPSPTSMTIVWHTNRPAVSKVEYWRAEEDAAGDKGRALRLASGQASSAPTVAAPAVMTAISAAHGLVDNDRTSHVIRLAGLRPGTAYRYRVISREFQGYEKQHIVKYGPTASSDTFSFTTLSPSVGQPTKPAATAPGPPAPPARPAAPAFLYSFAVFSDIHENAKRLDTMLGMIDWTRTPFVVFNGDMVNDFMNADQPFTGFVDVSVSRLRSRSGVTTSVDGASARQADWRTIPFVYIRGNHDVRGRFARRLTDYFPAYVSGGARPLRPGQASSAPTAPEGRAYYSFDHGPVHFIVLDSGEDKVDSHEYYNGLVAFEAYRREQAQWLAEDLRTAAARRARYRIVFSHIPPYDGAADSRRLAQKAAGAQVTREEGFAIQQVRECWEKIANAGGVNLWLSGHTHRFAHIPPPVGTAGTSRPSATHNRYHLVIGAPDTFTRVDVSRTGLTVTVTRETGDVVKAITIR